MSAAPAPFHLADGREFEQRWTIRRYALTFLIWVGLMLHAAGLWVQPWLQSLDWLIYDQRLAWMMPRSMDDRVVIVDVDERSVTEVGQWPWARDQVAQLVRELADRQQVASLGLDTVFVEADGRSPSTYLGRLARDETLLNLEQPAGATPDLQNWLQRVAIQYDFDKQLATALHHAPVSLGYYFSSDRRGVRSGMLPAPLARPERLPPGMLYWDGYGANLPMLTQAAPAAGFFNAMTDADGVVRRVPLLAAFDGGLYPSLALSSLRLGLGQSPLRIHTNDDGQLTGLSLLASQQLDVPMDVQGAAYVPYRGPGGPQGQSFRYISAVDVLQQKLPPDALRGRHVLLGFSTPGLMDLRATPAGQAFPGVEVHANLISGMLDGRLAVRPDYAAGYEMLRLSVLAALLVFSLSRRKTGPALSLGGLLLALVWGMDWALLHSAGLVLPSASALTLLVLGLGIHLTLGYLVENRARRRLANQFATYVPPELVRQMLREPDHYNMQARTETLTVMFCDLRGFTTLAEGMEPQAVQRLLSEVLTRLTYCIRDHQGTVDKYMGDCVMAFWGAPVAQDDHAARAFAAAQSMLLSLQSFNAERVAQGLPGISVGIGLNTGPMSVGNMGSDLRRAYTVIGDAVNLGARLEALTRIYQVDLIVSHSTKEAVPELILWQELDSVRVKGRSEAVRIYTPRARAGEANAELQTELAQWQQALALWRKGDLAACAPRIHALAAAHPDVHLYALYAQRLQQQQGQPASDSGWDSSIAFAQKK